MTLFTYNNAVPDPNNDPSNDVTPMLSNAIKIAEIWDVDHVGFNVDEGGTHLQTTFSSKIQPQPKPILNLFFTQVMGRHLP